MNYRLEDLSPEEAKTVTEKLQAVLAEHNCEMGVTSSIQILKRVDVAPAASENTDVVSPIQKDDLENGSGSETQSA